MKYHLNTSVRGQRNLNIITEIKITNKMGHKDYIVIIACEGPSGLGPNCWARAHITDNPCLKCYHPRQKILMPISEMGSWSTKIKCLIQGLSVWPVLAQKQYHTVSVSSALKNTARFSICHYVHAVQRVASETKCQLVGSRHHTRVTI